MASIAKEYCKELCIKFKDTPTLTLAKKAYKEQPKLFKTLESARTTIRLIRGLSGGSNRISVKDKSLHKEKSYNYNPFDLPESKIEKRATWNLPKSIKKVLLLSDIHIPYQDNEALTTALNYGKNEGIDAIFLNGDILDFYQLSFHEKDPRVTSIADELEMCRNFFKSLRKNFPKTKIYYITGNHEARMERYLRVKAPELLDIAEFRIDVLLKVAEYGIEYIENGTKCYFGKLLVEHGDKMKGSGGVNPARTLYLRLKRHAICGHFHRTTEATEKVYDGDVYVTYSTGCLCELEPRYMEVNNHNHGFAIVEMDGDLFTVHNKKIINESLLMERLETPIEIINGTHIELTKLVFMGGDWYENRYYFHVGDIAGVEASRYGLEKKRCTKIHFGDSSTAKFKEHYLRIRNTHAIWISLISQQESNNKEDANNKENTNSEPNN